MSGSIFWTKVKDDHSSYWVLYEHGKFRTPIFMLDHYTMKQLAQDVLHSVHIDDLPEAVKNHRKNHGLSQEVMAERLGISRNYLSQIERGLADNLSMRLYENIIGYLAEND